MEKIIRQIAGLLQHTDGMRRCAGAMVLAELAPKDPLVVKALADAMKDGSQLLTKYILDAFEAIGTKSVVPHVLPLLEVDDVELKLRAARIVARAGDEMLDVLKKQFETSSAMQKRVLIDIIARIHTKSAMQIILDTMFDPDYDLVREACSAVRRHITPASPADRKTLSKQVVRYMTTERVKKSERVLMSCLELTGAIGAPDAQQVLLHYSAPRNPIPVRHCALLGLKGMALTGSDAIKLAKSLLPYLDDADYPHIVQPTLDLIERLPLSPAFSTQWNHLLKNKHTAVRAFAARKLAATDDPSANKQLIRLLAHPDLDLSEIAAGGLARHKTATPLLLAALIAERNPDKAHRLARILKPHCARVDKKTVAKISTLAANALADNNPRDDALLYFLRHADPAAADLVLRDSGLKFKSSKKWAQAVRCFKQLGASNLFDASLRYDLSVCHLKLSTKNLSTHARADDYALRGFHSLLQDKAFNLLERLLKDKSLDANDLFYVGFHFSEQTSPERDFGLRLLEHVAKKWPASKDGKAAKNKLKLLATQPAS